MLLLDFEVQTALWDGYSHSMLIINYKSLSLKTHFKVCLKWVPVLPLVNLCIFRTVITLGCSLLLLHSA